LFGSGLNPGFFTLYNGKVLFNGTNASGDAGLWVTDGTVNGTHELTGIAGADSSGLEPADLTVYNGKVYFYGLETDQTAGLWVTDGTAAGTHELAGVSPSDLTVLNGKLLFDGDDGLWVTDGTAAGTHELTGIAGADSFAGLEPSGFTPVTLAALTSNSILFQGASGQAAIWNMTGTNVSGAGPREPQSWAELARRGDR
jgi:ELWxxDGT repeat protein